jgi:hypothetical protein
VNSPKPSTPFLDALLRLLSAGALYAITRNIAMQVFSLSDSNASAIAVWPLLIVFTIMFWLKD